MSAAAVFASIFLALLVYALARYANHLGYEAGKRSRDAEVHEARESSFREGRDCSRTDAMYLLNELLKRIPRSIGLKALRTRMTEAWAEPQHPVGTTTEGKP